MIDTHAHLFNEYYTKEEIDKIVNSFDGNIIVSGTDDLSNKEVLKLNYKNVYFTLGIHPEDVLNYKDSDIDFIEENINNDKVVGIGEIGLDYHYEKETREKQITLFKKQLDMARKYKKAVVIHSRDAINDTINILKDYKDVKKVLHCYSGSIETANELIKLNTYFGIGGVLTFKNNKLVDVVKNLPLDRIVLETDSPFLSPCRGEKNEPKNICIVASKIAEIKDISYEEVLDITKSNAISLFDLKI